MGHADALLMRLAWCQGASKTSAAAFGPLAAVIERAFDGLMAFQGAGLDCEPTGWSTLLSLRQLLLHLGEPSTEDEWACCCQG
jgi:hypothetical protein